MIRLKRIGSVGRILAALAVFALFTLLPSAARAQNYSDIWWNPAESGWGLTIADHQSQLFAVWFTYRADGKPTWYVIPGGTFSTDRRLFSGDVYTASGPAYTPVPFDATRVAVRKVGTATLDFAPPGLAAGTATYAYTVDGITQTKQIQRLPFGNAAPAWGADVTDIWWNPAESGWGLTLAQHGGDVFVVWFTYDSDGQPLWVVLPTVTFNGPDNFAGDLLTAVGPYFGTQPFDSSKVVLTKQGTATIAVTRQGNTNAQCAGGMTAVFTPVFRGSTAPRSICAQAFGDAPTTSIVIAAPVLPPIPSSSSIALAAAALTAAPAYATLFADLPDLALLVPDAQRVETSLRNGLLAQLTPQVAAQKAAFPAAGPKDGTAGDFTGLGFVIAGGQDMFNGVPAGHEFSASASQTVDTATATIEMGGGTNANGDTVSTYSLKMHGSKGDVTGDLNVTAQGQGKPCPAADGTLSFKLNVISSVQGTIGGKAAGKREELEVTGTANVNDAAYIENVAFQLRVQVSAQRPSSHNAFLDATYTGTVSGQWDDNRRLTTTITSAKLNRAGSTTTPDDLPLLSDGTTHSAQLMAGYLDIVQGHWREGACVQVLATAPSSVAPGSSTAVPVSVRHKIERIEMHTPIDSSLAGAASLTPTRVAAAPGTFTYVASSQEGASATLTFKSTSRRGIGTIDLDVRTVQTLGFEVDWNDGQGNHVFGVLCGGVENPFTLNFDSGGQATGTLAFTPSSPTAGSVHLTGSGAGGVVTYDGKGTYTVSPAPAIVMSIPTQNATFPSASGPQTISVPGPSGTLPLNKTTKCGTTG